MPHSLVVLMKNGLVTLTLPVKPFAKKTDLSGLEKEAMQEKDSAVEMTTLMMTVDLLMNTSSIPHHLKQTLPHTHLLVQHAGMTRWLASLGIQLKELHLKMKHLFLLTMEHSGDVD